MNVSLLEAEGHAHGDKSTPGIEQTDLTTLVKHRERTQASTVGSERCINSSKQISRIIALSWNRTGWWACLRGHIGFLMGHRYGFSIYSRDPVREHMVENPLMLRRGTAVRQGPGNGAEPPGQGFQ